MDIHVRNRLQDESAEDYQAYLDELFAPMGEAIQAALRLHRGEPDE